MEKIIEILKDIDDSIEWEKEQGLIDRRRNGSGKL